jgi:hypothetical protein
MPAKDLFFTIATGNYIPMANLLGESVRKHHPDADFKIVVIYGFNPDKKTCPTPFELLPVESLGIERLEELAFKYDLTEFCTAIKPICFQHFFREEYQKIIYFDPDIFVFRPIEPVLTALDTHPICLTPHLLFPEKNYSGHWPQGRLLASGIYNLGFLGLSRHTQTDAFLEWWGENLLDFCFSERRDGLFTDQKWMNHCPVFFPDTFILYELGCNIALWNIHERALVTSDQDFRVARRHSDGKDSSPLYFFHFSNFNFKQSEKEFESFLPFGLDDAPDAIPVVDFYRKKLAETGFVGYNQKPDYRFNYFNNGIHVTKIHRRLYRKLLETGVRYASPFDTGEGSFYSILKRNHLIAMESDNMDTQHLRTLSNGSGKFDLATKALRICVRLIGVKRYTFLCRFMNWLSKYENQLFLLREYKDKSTFSAPKGYINIKEH